MISVTAVCRLSARAGVAGTTQKRQSGLRSRKVFGPWPPLPRIQFENVWPAPRFVKDNVYKELLDFLGFPRKVGRSEGKLLETSLTYLR
jgi:hypothetical protein